MYNEIKDLNIYNAQNVLKLRQVCYEYQSIKYIFRASSISSYYTSSEAARSNKCTSSNPHITLKYGSLGIVPDNWPQDRYTKLHTIGNSTMYIKCTKFA